MTKGPVNIERFEKSIEYVESIFNFVDVLHKKSLTMNNNTLMNICKLIFKYLMDCCMEKNITIKHLKLEENYSMKSVYDYINDNKIELYDLININMNDVDITNPLDIERFVLSHIYYIYENN